MPANARPTRPSSKAQEPSVNLGRVAVPKGSDVLADHLRQQILTDKLPVGSALPVERVLATSVGLGRQTVRDALRVLEIEGLIVTRPGRAGGSFVRRPDASTLERTLNVLVGAQGIPFKSLLEAREGLEPVAAQLAALHRTESDLAMLEESNSELECAMGDMPRFLRCNADWHVAVGTASHNPIVEAVVNSLARVILRSTDIDEFHSAKTMADTIAAHNKILGAIRASDSVKAAAAMSAHVHTYRRLVEAYQLPEDVSL